MDMQVRVLGTEANTTDLTREVANAAASARAVNIPVIYVVVGFRPNHREISSRNKVFSAIARDKASFIASDAGAEIHGGVGWLASDTTVTKRRVSAFSGSDLEVVLRSMEIQDLVLSGVATSGVVLSTVREAADKDYRLTVLSDCCRDPDEEVHRLLMTKVFPRQAEVLTGRAWSQAL